MLSQRDYIKILNFYQVSVPNSKVNLKKKAEMLLATKLCKCIKATGFEETKAIKICTKSVFQRKGLTRGKFNCKGKKNVTFRKKTK
jgi:hypothetical protein